MVATVVNCSKCRQLGPSPPTSNTFCTQCRQCAVCCASKNSRCENAGPNAIASTHDIAVVKSIKPCVGCKQFQQMECSNSGCQICGKCAVCAAKSPICNDPNAPKEVDESKRNPFLAEQKKRGLVVGAVVQRNPASWKSGDQVSFLLP